MPRSRLVGIVRLTPRGPGPMPPENGRAGPAQILRGIWHFGRPASIGGSVIRHACAPPNSFPDAACAATHRAGCCARKVQSSQHGQGDGARLACTRSQTMT